MYSGGPPTKARERRRSFARLPVPPSRLAAPLPTPTLPSVGTRSGVAPTTRSMPITTVTHRSRRSLAPPAYPQRRARLARPRRRLVRGARRHRPRCPRRPRHRGQARPARLLHPAASRAEVRLGGNGRVRVRADHHARAGPGYHIHLCELLRHFANDFDLTWDDDACHDPTAYFTRRTAPRASGTS